MMRQYRDIPLAYGLLYKDSHYVKDRHGNDLQITIDLPSHTGAPAASSLAASTGAQLVSGQVRTRRRRQVTIVKESFSADEEHVFERLHEAFTTLAEEFGGKTIFEITDIFMKVSGDMENLRACLQKQKESAASEADCQSESMPCEWSYLEDIALSMPENSSEYRDLLMKKGREEIDKRKIFLLGAQGSLQLMRDTNLVTHP